MVVGVYFVHLLALFKVHLELLYTQTCSHQHIFNTQLPTGELEPRNAVELIKCAIFV